MAFYQNYLTKIGTLTLLNYESPENNLSRANQSIPLGSTFSACCFLLTAY